MLRLICSRRAEDISVIVKLMSGPKAQNMIERYFDRHAYGQAFDRPRFGAEDVVEDKSTVKKTAIQAAAKSKDRQVRFNT